MASSYSGVTTPDRDAVPHASRSGVWLTDGLLLLMALIWGVNFSVVKFGTQALDPLAFNATRIGIATVALLLVAQLREGARPARRDILALIALGVLGNGIYQLLFVEGIARTRAGDAALVISAAPAFIAIIGRLRGVERISPRGALGIVLSLVGIALVVFGAGQGATADAPAPVLGDALLLGAALAWSLYSVLLKPYTDRVDGVELSAWTMVGGVLAMAAVAGPALARTPWVHLAPAAWGALGYSSLLALVVAYLFYYRGIRVLGPTRTAMYANLQPVVALIVAWVALGETPVVSQVAGAVAIMAGLLLTRA